MADQVPLAAIVRAGLAAPSGDNCQPWRFSWDGTVLAIHWVPERAASLYDARRSASWIALGALLTNTRVTANALGWRCDVALFPSADCAARVTLSPAQPADHPLRAAIERRCANRRPYRATPIPPKTLQRLRQAAADDPAVHLTLVTDPSAIRQLAAVAARNDRLLFEHRRLHDGLFRWLRWTEDEVAREQDGLPVASLELSPMERPGFRLLQSWPVARALAALGLTRLLPRRTAGVYRRSAAIGCLSIAGEEAEDFVRGGEALERLWLTVTCEGLAFQPITGITCLILHRRLEGGAELSPAQRALLADAEDALDRLLPGVRARTPIMLFRLGYANPPTARTLRRQVEDVLTTHGAH